MSALAGHESSLRTAPRGRVIAVVVLALLVGVPVVLFGFGPSLLVAYDRQHLTEVRCVVHSAKADIASSQGSNGVGSSDPQVVIGTSCGKLILKTAVSRDNMREFANAVEVDSP